MTLESFASTETRHYTPGPGAYDTERCSSVGNKYSIHVNVRPKFGDPKPLTSGIDFPPMTTSLSHQSHTIRPRIPLKSPGDETPGPSYAPDLRQHYGKSVAIKIRYKDPETSNYPGPGKYSPRDEWPKTQVPQMGHRPAIHLSDVSESPGPAAYDTARGFGGRSSRHTIRPRTATRAEAPTNPGFAYNNLSVAGDSTPRWTMPKARSRRPL
jgi:hypothetical protein